MAIGGMVMRHRTKPQLIHLVQLLVVSVAAFVLMGLAIAAHHEYARLHVLASSDPSNLPASPKTYFQRAHWLTWGVLSTVLLAGIGFWHTKRLGWIAAIVLCVTAFVITFTVCDVRY